MHTSFRQALKDFPAFGFATMFKGLTRTRRSQPFQIAIPEIGPITIRGRNSDYFTVRQCFRDREYAIPSKIVEARIRSEYQSILSAGKVPVIIDAGANIGTATLWFRSQYPEAAIIAIEPEHDNFYILKNNLLSRPGLFPVNAAIGASSGFVEINNPGQGWAATTERSTVGCPVITVDDALGTIDNGVLFIVKIDIEGFESDLFSENLGWIDRSSAIFVEPHDWLFPGKHTSLNLQKAMAEREFELLLCGENLLYVNYGMS